jgi:hypothetical protein
MRSARAHRADLAGFDASLQSREADTSCAEIMVRAAQTPSFLSRTCRAHVDRQRLPDSD